MLALALIALALFVSLKTKRDPFQVNFLTALIGAGAALVGGALDRKQRNKELEMQDPVYLRERAEAAGFNPSAWAGHVPSLSYAPTMGSTIANGVAAAMDIFNNSKGLEIEKARLEMENERLAKHLNKTILTPDVPGVYGNGRNSTDNTGSSTGDTAGSGSPSSTPLGPRTSIIKLEQYDQSHVATQKGSLEEIAEFYGDEVSDAQGFLNYARDWWKGSFKGEIYYPGFGFESEIKRPKLRPRNLMQRYQKPHYVNPTTFGMMMNPG